MLLQTKKINSYTVFFSTIVTCILFLSSCQSIDLYEKVVNIPRQEWKSNFKPQFNFTINDTQSRYDVYVIIRHNEKYEFNNIWISLAYQLKGQQPVAGQYELPLANNEGWLGIAMDDLYEHRIRITPADGILFKEGDYTFTIGQIMRKDPLENVLNVGLRIEKKRQ
ncbi:MAG TPA: gliding motility lipoprotein GldH [Flavisolibacter sp.]|jgi:gliding motility-associated lipoprotein GldH|nr:gliding motility lipoprotein GldH [Flavisolibacter sp.]